MNRYQEDNGFDATQLKGNKSTKDIDFQLFCMILLFFNRNEVILLEKKKLFTFNL